MLPYYGIIQKRLLHKPEAMAARKKFKKANRFPKALLSSSKLATSDLALVCIG
jgi:hypothetical protein